MLCKTISHDLLTFFITNLHHLHRASLASTVIFATFLLSVCSLYLNDVVYTVIRQFLENEFTNKTETVYCMMEHMRKDRTTAEVFQTITTYTDDMIAENLENYLEKLEMKCNASLMSSPLGVAALFSIVIVVFAGVSFCLCKTKR